MGFLLSCTTACTKEAKLQQALQLAGENRHELEKVLQHYKEDSLKLKAAKFLITNMPYHFAREEYLCSPTGEKQYIDTAAHKDYNYVKKHFDSLQHRGYSERKEIIYDIKKMKASFLIHNIELAFSVREKPWVNNLSFADFCNYILPYRSQNEPLSNLREAMIKEFMPLLDSAKVETTIQACMVINEELRKKTKYKETGLSLYPTIEETHKFGIGRCEALCNYAIFVMRAVGIPVTIFQTTWTKMDLGHFWGAVLYKGSFYDFGPGSDSPYDYGKKMATTRYLKPAKVYQQRYDPIEKCDINKDDGYITPLKSPRLHDVTERGNCAVTNISISKDLPSSDAEKQVYLCAYNYYQWTPIDIGMGKNDSCFFQNVVGNNIFIVAEAINSKELKYITAPFVVDSIGNTKKFIPNKAKTTTQTFAKNRNEYTRNLYYWDVEGGLFKLIPNSEVTSDTTLLYSQIPDNSLLWYTTPHRAIGQRVGFLKGSKFIETWNF